MFTMANKNNSKSKLALHLLLLCCSCAVSERTSAVFGCARRVQIARAHQEDEAGRQCWDVVAIASCAGRCDSREISDWEFPYKKSHHPVCVHASRRPVTLRLRHCEPGVTPGTELFHYVAAEDCRCGVCSSENTSCEWLPPNSTLLHGSKSEDLSKNSYDVNDVLNSIL